MMTICVELGDSEGGAKGHPPVFVRPPGRIIHDAVATPKTQREAVVRKRRKNVSTSVDDATVIGYDGLHQVSDARLDPEVAPDIQRSFLQCNCCNS